MCLFTITEKFKMYISDTENWEVSENTYYYKKNHSFKIVRINNDENIRRLNSESYIESVRDTFISKDYWDHRDMNSADDYFSWFDIELYADNTLIKKYTLMEIFAKYYFSDKNLKHDTFYIPLLNHTRFNNRIVENKEEILSTIEWNLCKILFKCSLSEDIKYSENDAAIILDNINYDFLQDTLKYITNNKSWIYGVSDEETKNSK